MANANLLYRNTIAKIYVEVLDECSNPVGVATTCINWYVKTPDNLIYSNDPAVATAQYNNGVGIYSATPLVEEESIGVYYIQYLLTKVGEHKYKFQVTDDDGGSVVLAVSGDIKVMGDGIF